jgi:hypothetical protein
LGVDAFKIHPQRPLFHEKAKEIFR